MRLCRYGCEESLWLSDIDCSFSIAAMPPVGRSPKNISVASYRKATGFPHIHSGIAAVEKSKTFLTSIAAQPHFSIY
jgi:hypothetical protein